VADSRLERPDVRQREVQVGEDREADRRDREKRTTDVPSPFVASSFSRTVVDHPPPRSSPLALTRLVADGMTVHDRKRGGLHDACALMLGDRLPGVAFASGVERDPVWTDGFGVGRASSDETN